MHVAFVAIHANGVTDPADANGFGGAETHAWTLASGLARLGWSVDMLVRTPRVFRERTTRGVRVLNSSPGPTETARIRHRQRPSGRPSRTSPSEFVRFAADVALLAAGALLRDRRADPVVRDYGWVGDLIDRSSPDRVVLFGVNEATFAGSLWASATGTPAVVCLESDGDLDPRFFDASQDYVDPYGVRGRDVRRLFSQPHTFVTQTPSQQAALAERASRAGVLLPGPIDLERWDAAVHESAAPPLSGISPDAPLALWVGRPDRHHKRPALLFDLAARLPHRRFLMLLDESRGGPADDVRAAAPPNVTIIGRRPFSEMPALMRRSALFVHTGSPEYEGAPNVFVQTAASRRPFVTLACTGEPFAAAAAAVACEGDQARFAEEVERLFASPTDRDRLGANGRLLVESRYTSPAVTGELARILGSASAAATPRGTEPVGENECA